MHRQYLVSIQVVDLQRSRSAQMHALSVNMLLLAPLLSFAQAGYTIANTITFDPASTRVNVLNYDNSNPLDTFYVRKGLIIGHKLGYMNESFAAQNANRTTMNPRDIDAVEDVSFNFSLNVDLGTTIIIGAVACFFFQSCLAWAVQKLVSAGVTSLQAGGVGITVTENGAAAKFKRETAQFESFACEYAVSDIYCTDESDYTTQALSMMSQV